MNKYALFRRVATRLMSPEKTIFAFCSVHIIHAHKHTRICTKLEFSGVSGKTKRLDNTYLCRYKRAQLLLYTLTSRKTHARTYVPPATQNLRATFANSLLLSLSFSLSRIPGKNLHNARCFRPRISRELERSAFSFSAVVKQMSLL